MQATNLQVSKNFVSLKVIQYNIDTGEREFIS